MGAGTSRPASGPEHEVVAFMKAAGLEVYAERMATNGFDDMETLLAIEDADMKALGFTPQHAALLKRKVQERHGPVFDEHHPVVAFLQEAGLAQYAQGFIRSGWDDMETLAMIDDEGMKEIGLPRGHVLKLRRRLREFRERQCPSAKQALAPAEALLIGSDRALSRASSLATTASAATSATLAGAPSRASSVASSAASSGASWEYGAPGEPAGEMQLSMLARAAKSASASSIQTTAPTHTRPAIAYSWEQVKQAGAAHVACLLYANLEKLCPEVLAHFVDDNGALHPESLRRLFAKLITRLGSSAAGEYDTPHLVTTLTKLGAVRLAAGVGEEQCRVLGKVLDLTLQQFLGDAYTTEVQRAWMTAYSFMSSVVLDGSFARGPPEDLGSSSEGEVDN